MSRPLTYARWTNHKLAWLRECYPVMTRAELAVEFSPHPIGSIMRMAQVMNLRKRDWKAICAAHKPVFNLHSGRVMA